MYWIKGASVNSPLVMWGWGRELVLSPIIKSQLFKEAVFLDCELHKRFSVFFYPLGETGWLEWARVRYFSSSRWKAKAGQSWVLISLPPGQFDPDNTQRIRLRWTGFPWGQTLLRREAVLSPLPPPEGGTRDFRPPPLCLYCGNPANFL